MKFSCLVVRSTCRYYIYVEALTIDTKVLFRVLFWRLKKASFEFPHYQPVFDLKQTQLTGAGDSLRPALDLQLVINSAVVSLDGIQCKEEPGADFLI